MADINFYKFLETAFRYRLNDPKGMTATPTTSYEAFGYKLTYKKIFEYARKVLPNFYLNSAKFPNTEEGNLNLAREVLKNLDKHLDLELETQFKTITATANNDEVIAEAQAESQQAAEQAAAAANTSGGGMPFGMPSGGGGGQAATPRHVILLAEEDTGTAAKSDQFTTSSTETPASQPTVTATSASPSTSTPTSTNPPQTHTSTTSSTTSPSSASSSYYSSSYSQPSYSSPLHNSAAQPKVTRTQRFNFSNFKNFNVSNGVRGITSKASIGINKGLGSLAKGAGKGISQGLRAATPTLGKLGSGLGGGLNGLSRLGGIKKGGSKQLGASSRKAAFRFVGVLLLFFALIGGIIGGDTQTGEAAPITGPAGTTGTNISTCKFTRGAESPKEASFQSSYLLSYIQEASQKSTIPPAVLAAFIRVESPSSSRMSNDQIANYAANCAESATGALGIMQIQPPGTTSAKGDPASCDDCIDAGAKLVGKTVSTMTRQDYCDPRTSVVVGSGWILKKMSKLGYGNGTRWDPSWTNNRSAIEALVNTYYGCVQYGGATDCTGPFNYADDVSTSIQHCQTTGSAVVPPPPADGNYQKWIEDNLKIKMDAGFTPEVYRWAQEILAQAMSSSPSFISLIHQQCPGLITLTPTTDISHAESCDIPLSFNAGEAFFKFLIIHELAHKINTTNNIYNNDIIIARAADAAQDTKDQDGFLSYYSKHAASAPDKICGEGQDNGNRADEEFADSVAYYINSKTPELNMHVADDSKGTCGIKWDKENPFLNGTRYTNHYNLITKILK